MRTIRNDGELMKLEAIAKAYIRRIRRNEITIEDVPESILETVRVLLDKEKQNG